MKLVVIERGRLDKESMNVIFGGKNWENCSDSGTACHMVSGNGFTIIKNCEHNLYTCDTTMKFCVNKDDLAACSGLPTDTKGIIRPI